MESLHETKPFLSAVIDGLLLVPGTWSPFRWDECPDIRQQALMRLTGSSLIEWRFDVTTRFKDGQDSPLQLFYVARGAGCFEAAIRQAGIDSGLFRDGKFIRRVTSVIGQTLLEVRLTAAGEVAHCNLNDRQDVEATIANTLDVDAPVYIHAIPCPLNPPVYSLAQTTVSADNAKIIEPVKYPENQSVTDLCKELAERFGREPEAKIAREFCAGTNLNPASMLRQARRYPHLWKR